MEKQSNHSFIKGAIILSFGMALVKCIGAFFKLPLANVITENGMGYFNTAYNFYAVFFSLATAGFPVAIAKLVAQYYSVGRYNDVKQIKNVAMPIFVVLGLISSLVMFFFAKSYTEFIGNNGAYLPILILSPTIIFCCLSSIYRGYFEGLRNMYPTAISEVLEALSKLVIGLALAVYAVSYFNKEYQTYGTVLGRKLSYDVAVLSIYSLAAAGAIFGVTVGSFLSFFYLYIKFKKSNGMINVKMQRLAPKAHSKKLILKQLLSLAIPIAIGSLAVSLAGLVDQTFLQKRISDIMDNSSTELLEIYSGMIPEENLQNLASVPNFLFGCFAYASTVFALVPAITQAFAVSALPNLTSAWVQGDEKKIKKGIVSVIKTTAIFCFPAGLGIAVLSEAIVKLLYGQSNLITAQILCVLGLAAMFSGLAMPLSSSLQAIGKVNLSVKLLIIGLIIKIILNYVLCGMTQININGAAISTFACYFFITITQLIAVKKVAKIDCSIIKILIKPFLCAALCASCAFFTYDFLAKTLTNGDLVCAISIAFSAVIYVLALLFSKTLTLNEVFMKKK